MIGDLFSSVASLSGRATQRNPTFRAFEFLSNYRRSRIGLVRRRIRTFRVNYHRAQQCWVTRLSTWNRVTRIDSSRFLQSQQALIRFTQPTSLILFETLSMIGSLLRARHAHPFASLQSERATQSNRTSRSGHPAAQRNPTFRAFEFMSNYRRSRIGLVWRRIRTFRVNYHRAQQCWVTRLSTWNRVTRIDSSRSLQSQQALIRFTQPTSLPAKIRLVVI